MATTSNSHNPNTNGNGNGRQRRMVGGARNIPLSQIVVSDGFQPQGRDRGGRRDRGDGADDA